MSVWYDTTISAYGSEEHLAKLIGVKPGDCRSDMIRLEFGAKNGPGVNIEELAKSNYGLIFLVESTVECHSGSTFLLRYDRVCENMQYVPLDSFDYDRMERNVKLLKDYPEAKKYGTINWRSFCYDDSKINLILNNHMKYQELSIEVSQEDIEFDQMEPIDD